MTKPTDDLIRKRSATERLIIAKTLLESILQDMPTAEPELANNSPKVENGNGDLISRQAALDALEWKWAGKAAIDAIKNLPTAEPELIRCKDCKFTDGDGPIADGRYWCVLHQEFMEFCSDAERRSDG